VEQSHAFSDLENEHAAELSRPQLLHRVRVEFVCIGGVCVGACLGAYTIAAGVPAPWCMVVHCIVIMWRTVVTGPAPRSRR